MTRTIHRFFSFVIVAILAVTSILATPSPVQAVATIYVTTTADEYTLASNGKCSLREAVIAANTNSAVGGCPAGTPGTDVIMLPATPDPNKPIIVGDGKFSAADENKAETGDLDILEPLVIRGAGAKLTRVTALKQDRVFHIINLGGNSVRLQNMTITGGNVKTDGGAIHSQGSKLYLENVIVTGNHASRTGGGVSSTRSSVGYPSLIIINSTFSFNQSTSGGGIYSEGSLDIKQSLISKNSAVETGGGIDNNAGPGYIGRLENTTVGENTAPEGAGITTTNRLILLNDTIFKNTGDGIHISQVNIATVEVKNTIIAGHSSPYKNCRIMNTLQNALVSNGNNLTDDGTCNLTASGDLANTNPKLLTLAANGGPTNTFALDDSSPAIDAGNNSGCPGIDQRMRGRPAIGPNGTIPRCDIGAYEANGTFKQIYLPSVRR